MGIKMMGKCLIKEITKANTYRQLNTHEHTYTYVVKDKGRTRKKKKKKNYKRSINADIYANANVIAKYHFRNNKNRHCELL